MAGDDLASFRKRLLERLRRVFDIDAAFIATADPATLLFTSASADPPLAGAAALFLDNEFAPVEDVNRFAVLARAPRPVATLDEATRGEWRRSARWRDVMQPLRLGDEMRAALRVAAVTWGFLCLHREGTGRFRPAEIDLLRQVAPHAGEALRRIAAERLADDDATGERAVVVVEGASIRAMTAAAAGWLFELGSAAAPGDPLPFALLVLVRQLESLERQRLAPPVAALTLATARGALVEVHAARLREADGSGPVTLTLAPAGAAARRQWRLAAYRLTPAQQRVAALVVQGCSTTQIAAALRISEHTAQDHLKAIFWRAGVGSRRELVNALIR